MTQDPKRDPADGRYSRILAELQALTGGIPHKIANLANAAALLWMELPEINWVGFYLVEGERLVLGPFQGRPACIEIPVGKGVCGTAVARGEVVLVPDVHQFPGHIACDSASRSEVAAPLWAGGKIVAVLDIDSPIPGRFGPADAGGLARLTPVLEEIFSVDCAQ